MDLWTMAWPDQEAYVTAVDFEAIEASLADVGAVVAEIGSDKPVGAYTKDEILRLMFSTVQAVQKHRMEIIGREEIPF